MSGPSATSTRKGDGHAIFGPVAGRPAGLFRALAAEPKLVEPAGDTLWVGDRGKDKAIALPMPN
jgi:hypothetical protein